MTTISRTLQSADALRLVAHLVAESVWFEVEPECGDKFTVTVKAEAKSRLFCDTLPSFYILTGRIIGWDEDYVAVIEEQSAEAAKAKFVADLRRFEGEDLDSEDPDSAEFVINSCHRSATIIEEQSC